MKSLYASYILSMFVGIVAFTLPRTHAFQSSLSSTKTSLFARRDNPEFSVINDADLSDDEQEFDLEEELALDTPVAPFATPVDPTAQKQYAALTPSTVVDIQVGDISLGRKAWKKRRRTGSPLLVPCSVLKADRASLLQWNIIYLLQKFGKGSTAGIRISLTQLAQRYRTHLKSSLSSHALALGHEDVAKLVEAIFTKKVQETTGIQLVENDGTLYLQSSIGKYKAQKRASKACLLQFTENDSDAEDLYHTGRVRNRRESPVEDENLYKLQMLSAALRVSQEDVDNRRIENGSFHSAFVFDYDLTGDGGSPLWTLSLNSPTHSQFDRLKMNAETKHVRISEPKHDLKSLNIGDMIEGTVIKFIPGGVLLDCGVGRTTSTGETLQVLATLKFSDALMRLKVGDDDIPVFVKSVSKQSSQLIVTMDDSVQGKKAKEIKRESEANKKLSRLEEQLGGLDAIEEMIGQEMDGVVQATSQTGDWVYVRPTETDLPVGIATLSEEMELSKGDEVRIQLQGIDINRGQLAMKILGRR